MLRLHEPRTAWLREWAGRIATRRGKGIAVVALARRLARILFALLRDGTVCQSGRRLLLRPVHRTLGAVDIEGHAPSGRLGRVTLLN